MRFSGYSNQKVDNSCVSMIEQDLMQPIGTCYVEFSYFIFSLTWATNSLAGLKEGML